MNEATRTFLLGKVAEVESALSDIDHLAGYASVETLDEALSCISDISSSNFSAEDALDDIRRVIIAESAGTGEKVIQCMQMRDNSSTPDHRRAAIKALKILVGQEVQQA
jgi:hypothetical protein